MPENQISMHDAALIRMQVMLQTFFAIQIEILAKLDDKIDLKKYVDETVEKIEVETKALIELHSRPPSNSRSN